MMKMGWAVLGLALAAAGCGPGATTKTEKTEAVALAALGPAPTRAAYEGCRWVTVTGGGVGIWSQECPTNKLVADEARAALAYESTVDGVTSRGDVIRVFDVPGGDLNALTAVLMREGQAVPGASCALQPAVTETAWPAGVQRYSLAPTGATKATWDAAVASDTPPETPVCGVFGVSIVGDRYIEVRAAHPDKAIFVELGSEQPIYEVSTLAFLPAKAGGDHKTKDAH